MSAEQREELKRLADEYASAMSVYQIHGSAADSVALHITKTNLHAAIDAHTAEPPINAAAQVLGAQANPVTAQDHMPVAAAPNEPVAPVLRELHAALCGVRPVGAIDGHEVIRRMSVLDVVEQRQRGVCDGAAWKDTQAKTGDASGAPLARMPGERSETQAAVPQQQESSPAAITNAQPLQAPAPAVEPVAPLPSAETVIEWCAQICEGGVDGTDPKYANACRTCAALIRASAKESLWQAERASPQAVPAAWSSESHLGALQDPIHEDGPARAAKATRIAPQAVDAPVALRDALADVRIEALKIAIEGECDGLAINDSQARSILQYLFEQDGWAALSQERPNEGGTDV
jgi:hypothetical protein